MCSLEGKKLVDILKTSLTSLICHEPVNNLYSPLSLINVNALPEALTGAIVKHDHKVKLDNKFLFFLGDYTMRVNPIGGKGIWSAETIHI